MRYVYYCVFCGFHTPELQDVPDTGRCASCAGALRACPAGEFAAVAERLEAGRQALRPRVDGALPLALLLTALWLAGLHDLVVVAGGVYLVLGAALARGAARREKEPALPWRLHAAAALAGATALGLSFAGHVPALVAGAAAGALLLAGLAVHVVQHPGWRRRTDRHLAVRMAAALAGAGAALAAGVTDGEHAAACAATALAFTGWVLAGAAVAERPAPTIADVKPSQAPAAEPEPVA